MLSDAEGGEKSLKRTLGAFQLVALGAGAFTLLPTRYLGGIVWSYFGLIN